MAKYYSIYLYRKSFGGVTMNQFTLHPNVYSTSRANGLIKLLEEIWDDKTLLGKGTIYIISGFGNYNGGIRFYPLFREHVRRGGRIIAFFGGSTSQRLTSEQVVEELLECGAEVNIVNRKRLLHAKCYGFRNDSINRLIVTSGNFTGPGMSQNVEAAISLDTDTVNNMNYSWEDIIHNINSQGWNIYNPSLLDRRSPAWALLYDEVHMRVDLDETQEVTMILKLGHADTARIQAEQGTNAAKGTQYFWLSKDCFDFFPALTIQNERGVKSTYSTLVNMNYIDIGAIDNECRVTFEAENNLDFRLGTGKLRGTRVAQQNDIAAITRKGETDYELRIIKPSDRYYTEIERYAINFIGHQGKRYGFVPNNEFFDIIE